jgi:hypothetical protein
MTRSFLEPCGEQRPPVIQIVDVLALQGVLVLRVRTTSADTDILRRLHEDDRRADRARTSAGAER